MGAHSIFAVRLQFCRKQLQIMWFNRATTVSYTCRTHMYILCVCVCVSVCVCELFMYPTNRPPHETWIFTWLCNCARVPTITPTIGTNKQKRNVPIKIITHTNILSEFCILFAINHACTANLLRAAVYMGRILSDLLGCLLRVHALAQSARRNSSTRSAAGRPGKSIANLFCIIGAPYTPGKSDSTMSRCGIAHWRHHTQRERSICTSRMLACVCVCIAYSIYQHTRYGYIGSFIHKSSCLNINYASGVGIADLLEPSCELITDSLIICNRHCNI